MQTSTTYHDTLEWYNKWLFGDWEGDEDEKELIQMDNNEDEDNPNITYRRRWQQQWEEESYTPTVSWTPVLFAKLDNVWHPFD